MSKRTKKSRDELLKLIRSFRGVLKEPGQRPMSEWWPEYKAEERRLEEARDKRLALLGKRKVRVRS